MSTAPPSADPPHPRTFVKMTQWFAESHPSLPAPERRRARLLSWLLLTLFLLLILTLGLVLIANPAGTMRRVEYVILIVGLMVLLALAFGLNRAGRYSWAAGITTAAAGAGPWGSLILDPAILHGDFVPLTYIALSILLGSILLSLRVTLVIAAIHVCGLLLLPVFTPTTNLINWPSLLAFVCFTSILGIVTNLISRKDLDQIEEQTHQLANSQAQLQAILDNSTAIIYLKDIQGRYLLINRQYESMFQVTREQVIGETFAELFPADIGSEHWEADQQVLQTNAPLNIEETLRLADDERTFISVKFPIRDAYGKPNAVCNISTDITERKKMEQALQHQSVRDPLTTLFNRRYLEETLTRELGRSERHQAPVGIMIADIDHFKRINDIFGHAVGDALLYQVGMFFRQHLRIGDVACRYGGDEFVLVLPEASRDVILARAEELRKGVKLLGEKNENRPVNVSLSIGLAIFPDHGSTSQTLMQAADAALYRAKEAGRDRVVIAA